MKSHKVWKPLHCKERVMRTLPLLSIVVVLSVTGSSARGGDGKNSPARWPQFRGPGSQGIGCDGLKLPTAFGTTTKMIWKTALPRGHSSPCVWDERIYVTGFVKKGQKLETICLDRSSGKVLWRQTAPATTIEKVHEINSPAPSTPATDGEQVYVYFGSYGLLCYSMDGELKWKCPLEPGATWFGSGTSPIVSGDLVLINAGKGKEEFSLFALDRRTGKTVWQADRRRGFATGVWSTPVVRHGADGDEVIVAGGNELAAYNLKDGAARWHIAGLPPISQSTPAIGDGLLFLTLTNPVGDPEENIVKLPSFDELIKKYDKNGDGKLGYDELPDDLVLFTRGRSDKVGDWAKVRESFRRYDKNKDKALDRQEWQNMLDDITKNMAFLQIAVVAIRLDGKGDVSKTHVAWKASKCVPDVPSPLYYQGRVYLVSERGIVTCRDARSGKEIYRERLGGRGTCYSSPVIGDNKIYVGTDGGVLVVFKPGDRFEILSKNDLGEGILATPALVDNKIYVRTDHHMHAFAE
jgi:outer membrane protein assembly factor BamB